MTSSPHEPTQARAIGILGDPKTHGLPPGTPIPRVDTHISHVFLAGDRAYKLKRERRLSFLDFSTLQARRDACLNELEVNRVAGDLYIGLYAVCSGPSGDGLRPMDADASPPDAVIDTVVAMRRFDHDDAFDAMLEAGRLDATAMRGLAETVAESQSTAPRRPQDAGVERVRRLVRNVSATIESVGSENVADWREAAMARIEKDAARLEARRRHGFVRRLHGDLHLGNIVMWRGRPTPFDALEFNDEMASIDVAYDAAFVAMDAIARGRVDLAAAFSSRWFACARAHHALPLWPLFLSIRAAVRAMVAAYQGDDATTERRMALAHRLAAWSDRPRAVLVGGLSGSGKTTVADALATRLDDGSGAVRISSDVTRKVLLGAAPTDRLPAAAYTPDITAQVARRMLAQARVAWRAGRVALVDATFSRATSRAAFFDAAGCDGVAIDGLWLDASLDARVARADDRATAGVDASDADRFVVARQTAEPLDGRWRRVAADGAVGDVVRGALSALSEASCSRSE